MWSRGRRREAESEARAAWLDAAALLEARSRADAKSVQDAQHLLVEKLADLHQDLASRDDRLTDVLSQVSAACGDVAEQLEADRAERRELVQTIGALASALAAKNNGAEVTVDRVIGGTVYGSGVAPRPDPSRPETIDLTVDDAAWNSNGRARPIPVGSPVRCRFGRRWVDGFDIDEAVEADGVTRYRVRRRSDRSLLLKLFEADDVRVNVRSASAPL
jgi:hypothetical protein